MIKSIVYTSVFCFLIVAVVNIREGSAAKLARSLTCGSDEVYNECGSACPPSCSDLFYPQEPRFCTLQCVSGCFCRSGLVRAKNGKCVEPTTCCTGSNEVYKKCGTSCPARCGFPSKECQCVEGCFCKKGFIRKDNTANSPCIRRTQC